MKAGDIRLFLLAGLAAAIAGCESESSDSSVGAGYSYGYSDAFFYDSWYGGYGGGGVIISSPPSASTPRPMPLPSGPRGR
jgi:hypothetical protein